MIWAFVDYENTGSLEALKLSEYEKVFVFCGPKNQRINFGSIPTNEFCSIEVIGVSTMGSNNLDFHIAFHLGRFHEIADKKTEFHLVSNDGGFNGLVNHLKKIGRKCKKVDTRKNSAPDKSSPALSECAAIVASRLRQIDGRTRPRKTAKLLNWIKSQCASIPNFSGPEDIFKELVDEKLINAAESVIRYKLK